MEIRKYPDNTSYSVITDLSKKEFTFRINSYEDLWHLGQTKFVIYNNNRANYLIVNGYETIHKFNNRLYCRGINNKHFGIKVIKINVQ